MTTASPNTSNDPNINIPSAVKSSSSRADELHKAIYGPKDDAPNPDNENESKEVTPPSDEDAAKQTSQEGASDEQVPEAGARREPDDESWEHRYKSMKGRFERSEAHNRSLLERISAMEHTIANLKMQGSAPRQQAQEDDPDTSLSPDEVNDYGEDFLKVVGKKARAEIAPILRQYQDEIASLKEQLQGVGGFVAKNAKERMHASLDERCPTWRQLNNDQNFIDWLKLPDTYSGAIRHNLLKEAYEQNDTPRVLAFFNGFLAEEAAVAPANRREPDPDAKVVGKVPLKDLAAPGRAKTAAASGAPAEKPFFTRADIAKFYADVASGKYRGRDAEKNRVEQQIFDAEREGRIR